MGEVLDQPQVTPAAVAKITLTDGAAQELARIRASQSQIPADHVLRVGVKGGGCSGFEYILGFDEAKDGDDVFESNGVRVAMNKSHAIYLLGMQIDYVQGLDNRGFSFNNPNATSTCGCGTSFAA
jgi:iron-sulfur cluster assembly protein